MKTIISGIAPPEIEQLIKKRQQLGQDLYDEIWEGDYHMRPCPGGEHGYLQGSLIVLLAPYAKTAGLSISGPFNVGEPDNFRVPDFGYHRIRPTGVWAPTAAIVVEVLSPDDDTYEKFPFYAAHGVEEILVVDGATRSVRWFGYPHQLEYAEILGSELLGITSAEINEEIDWP